LLVPVWSMLVYIKQHAKPDQKNNIIKFLNS
jgi:hypothetical protein